MEYHSDARTAELARRAAMARHPSAWRLGAPGPWGPPEQPIVEPAAAHRADGRVTRISR